MFVSGISGQAGFEILRQQIERTIKDLKNKKTEKDGEPFAFPAPSDWAYVFNFSTPRMPIPIPFKKGTVKAFQKKMHLLLDVLRKEVPKAASAREILQQISQARSIMDEWVEEQHRRIYEKAREYGLGVSHLEIDSAEPPTIFPLSKSGIDKHGRPTRITNEEEFALSDEERKTLGDRAKEIASLLQGFIDEFNRRAGETNQIIYDVRKGAVTLVIEHIFGRLGVLGDVASEEARETEELPLAQYIRGLKDYSLVNFSIFGQEHQPRQFNEMIGLNQLGRNPFLPWDVNVFVDNGAVEDIPVIAERISSFPDLVGFIDPVHVLGGAIVDHTRIIAGVLAKANDGFLILNVRNLLMIPGLWELIKRTIKTQCIKIETLASFAGYDPPPLQPIPIPFNARVVVFGDPTLMELLIHYDEEFLNLFKIRAEVMPFVERSREQVAAFGAWIQWQTKREKEPDFSKSGVAALIEHAGRIAHNGNGSQNDLSTDFAALETVIKEAALHAKKEYAKNISREHVERALKEMFWRSDLAYQLSQKMVEDGTILISCGGKAVGKINALAVSSRGDITFGFPSRIVAQVSLGALGFVNIQYDVGLGGKFLNKAGKTIEGLLRGQFARTIPLAISVFVSFEQAYSMIDGDSASLAQYLVTISQIAEVPLEQGIAVTGSLNLHGDIQPIGGVNTKIEGFFDVCVRCGGLSGKQGVIIPWQNKNDLMLRPDVVNAVREKRFHVWAVQTIDEAIEIFTGMKATRVRDRVVKSLENFSRIAKEFSGSKK